MRQIFLDETHQKFFLSSGYLAMPMLCKAEVESLLEEVGKLRPHDGFAPLSPNGVDITYHCSFLDSNRDYKAKVHQLITAFFEPHISRVLKDFHILNCNFYVKAPHSGEFVVHQNWPAIADINDTTVTVWCPLVNVVESNGALQVVPGSHKLVPHIEGPGAPPFFDSFRQEMIEKYLEPIPMTAGDALIFDDSLIHWSARNDSDEPRIAIQILCVPNNAQAVYFYADPEHPKRFELFQVDSRFYIESGYSDLLKKQPHWKSLGFVENRNRMLTEQEFKELLQNGDEIRRRLYLSQDRPQT